MAFGTTYVKNNLLISQGTEISYTDEKLDFLWKCRNYVHIITKLSALENLLTDGFLKSFQELNQIQISVDIRKRKLYFQINYSLTSGVKYMNHFREINQIFYNSCGNYVHIITKLSALENLMMREGE